MRCFHQTRPLADRPPTPRYVNDKIPAAGMSCNTRRPSDSAEVRSLLGADSERDKHAFCSQTAMEYAEMQVRPDLHHVTPAKLDAAPVPSYHPMHHSSNPVLTVKGDAAGFESTYTANTRLLLGKAYIPRRPLPSTPELTAKPTAVKRPGGGGGGCTTQLKPNPKAPAGKGDDVFGFASVTPRDVSDGLTARKVAEEARLALKSRDGEPPVAESFKIVTHPPAGSPTTVVHKRRNRKGRRRTQREGRSVTLTHCRDIKKALADGEDRSSSSSRPDIPKLPLNAAVGGRVVKSEVVSEEVMPCSPPTEYWVRQQEEDRLVKAVSAALVDENAPPLVPGGPSDAAPMAESESVSYVRHSTKGKGKTKTKRTSKNKGKQRVVQTWAVGSSGESVDDAPPTPKESGWMKAWNRVTKPKKKKASGRRHIFHHHNALHYHPNFLVDINSARYDRYETTYEASTKYAGQTHTCCEPSSAANPSCQSDAGKGKTSTSGGCGSGCGSGDAAAVVTSSPSPVMPDAPPPSRADAPSGPSAVEADLVVEEYDEVDVCGGGGGGGAGAAAVHHAAAVRGGGRSSSSAAYATEHVETEEEEELVFDGQDGWNGFAQQLASLDDSITTEDVQAYLAKQAALPRQRSTAARIGLDYGHESEEYELEDVYSGHAAEERSEVVVEEEDDYEEEDAGVDQWNRSLSRTSAPRVEWEKLMHATASPRGLVTEVKAHRRSKYEAVRSPHLNKLFHKKFHHAERNPGPIAARVSANPILLAPRYPSANPARRRHRTEYTDEYHY